MRITPDLAKRIQARRTTGNSSLSDDQKMELLMDWLEGHKYAKLAETYHISEATVGVIIKQARAEAAKVLDGKK